jgi:hypothetical protein
MKKNLLIALVLIFPFIAVAQDEPPVLKDFYSKAKDIPTSFIFNDHVNIMQVNKNNESFEMIAVEGANQIVAKKK